MNRRSEQGFTIIEIMLAVIVLSVGVMALVGSSALATRMIGRGAQTSPGCTNANVKTDSNTTASGIGEKWVLLGNAGDFTRDVRMTFSYRVYRGTRTDTMMITLYCK
jgi:prepilin-type N-terminal cleavage/methylation domain-containing protein